jgi:hypothetical protein
VDVLSSHLALIFVPPLDPVWAGLRLIPLAVLALSIELVGLLVDREWSGCRLWAVS